MAWPAPVSSSTNFSPTLVNTWLTAIQAAQGTYNGNAQVSAGWSQIGVTPAAGADAILSTPPVLVSAGTQAGGVNVMRANSFDTLNHTRDFGLRVSTTSNAGNGKLEILGRLDGAAWTSLLSLDQSGNLTTSSAVGGLASLQLAPQTLPGSPSAGMFAVDATDIPQFYNGSGWMVVSTSGAWQAATLTSAITNNSIGYGSIRFKISGQHVVLSGLGQIVTVAAGTVLFTLPVGYRPTIFCVVMAWGMGTSATSTLTPVNINVNTSGQVLLESNSLSATDLLSFENIRIPLT